MKEDLPSRRFLQALPSVGNPPRIRPITDLIIVAADMQCTRTIRSLNVLIARARLSLSLQRCIATTQQRVAYVVEAVVVVCELVLVNVPVFVANLHDQGVHVTRDMHQAMQLVEDCDREKVMALLVRGLIVVHGGREVVRGVVWHVDEAAANCERVSSDSMRSTNRNRGN